VRRAARGAEREELLAALEELAAWYRDLIAAAAGAETALVHADRATELREDGTLERLEAAARAAELVRETWRNFEELQLSARLALEALFVELRRAFAGAAVAQGTF
jgi:DNA polymerase-3 subunit delta'